MDLLLCGVAEVLAARVVDVVLPPRRTRRRLRLAVAFALAFGVALCGRERADGAAARSARLASAGRTLVGARAVTACRLLAALKRQVARRQRRACCAPGGRRDEPRLRLPGRQRRRRRGGAELAALAAAVQTVVARHARVASGLARGIARVAEQTRRALARAEAAALAFTKAAVRLPAQRIAKGLAPPLTRVAHDTGAAREGPAASRRAASDDGRRRGGGGGAWLCARRRWQAGGRGRARSIGGAEVTRLAFAPAWHSEKASSTRTRKVTMHSRRSERCTGALFAVRACGWLGRGHLAVLLGEEWRAEGLARLDAAVVRKEGVARHALAAVAASGARAPGAVRLVEGDVAPGGALLARRVAQHRGGALAKVARGAAAPRAVRLLVPAACTRCRGVGVAR